MMKGSFAVALATGTLLVVASGGFAMAIEAQDPGDPVAVVTSTASPEESSGEEASGDASSLDAPTDEGGLVCVLVPIEIEEAETDTESTDTETETEPTDTEPQTIEQLLAVNEIECSGTGNERSAEVALVPRYLAHSDEFSGAEKGAAISAWAKTQANKKSGDKNDDEDGGETSGGVSESSSDEPSSGSPGRSGDAPGHSGSQPGNGRGR
jgi:hypothetical protein